MKTVNKFSVLLLMTAVLLCSNMFALKGSTVDPKAITISDTGEIQTSVRSEYKTEMKTDTTLKNRKASCLCGQLTVTCVGPDPERRSICHCHLCKKQTGSAFSVQARFPKEEVKIEGKSTVWKYPNKEETIVGRTCADGGTTFYFCPVCGSTVYYIVDADPSRIGVKMGSFADPRFPPPMISGFEEYKFPWIMDIEKLPMPGGHHN